MKRLQIAVVLLVLYIGTLEALRCKYCLPSYAGGICHYSAERCLRPDDICAKVYNKSPDYLRFKRCMGPAKVLFYKSQPESYRVITCFTDLCN